MFGDEKNLKDINSPLPNLPLVKGEEQARLPDGQGGGLSYTKTNKLITALYIVTDIIDKEEPLRNKLRTLGVEILSDIISLPRGTLDNKIQEVLSFLDIAGTVNLISDMNLNILRKEFFELKKALEELIQIPQSSYSEVNLTELFGNDFSLPSARTPSTHIGVQRGSTLLKALSGVQMSDRKRMSDSKNTNKTNINFEVLKRQRRNVIISLIKASPSGATITDIKAKASSLPAGEVGPLASCGEKTLQRELVSMVKDNVLNKTGEKRWSRYFIT